MIDHHAQRVVDACVALGLTVGTAESLTGGLVASRLVDVPGASATFRGGVVSYTVDLKTSLLGVPAEVIARHGVVSAETAEAMAQGARTHLGVDIALATTGVAGPGPHDGVPQGTVVVAVSTGESTHTRRIVFSGDRATVRGAAVGEVLALVMEILGK